MASPAAIEILKKAVIDLRDQYIDEGADDARDINRGQCEDFAEDLREKFADKGFATARDISIDEYMQPMLDGDDNNYGYPFDRELLEASFPGFKPPKELSMDDLDHVSSYASFSPGTHVWVVHEGRHYDAEAPEGVESPFELPFFQRIINRWIKDGRPERASVASAMTF